MTKPAVLLVEDNPADLYLVNEAVRQFEIVANWTVMGDGEAAIRYLQEKSTRPALVVLDLNLPKKNGIQVLEYIRNTPDYHEVPVIVFTSSVSAQDYTRIRELGVSTCLLKSLDLDEFNRIGLAIKQVLEADPDAVKS